MCPSFCATIIIQIISLYYKPIMQFYNYYLMQLFFKSSKKKEKYKNKPCCFFLFLPMLYICLDSYLYWCSLFLQVNLSCHLVSFCFILKDSSISSRVTLLENNSLWFYLYVNVLIYSLSLKNTLAVYRILDDSHFLSPLWIHHPMAFWLHGFKKSNVNLIEDSWYIMS